MRVGVVGNRPDGGRHGRAADRRGPERVAEALALPLPFASVVHNRFLAAVAQGEADLDFAVLGRHAARDAGLKE